MKKITFKRQVFIGIMLIAVGNILALILHEGLCANIAWVLYGLVLIINPVYPERYNNDAKKSKMGNTNSRIYLYFGRSANEVCCINPNLSGHHAPNFQN